MSSTSASTSASTNVRQEFNRLSLVESGITEDEFGDLLAYITNNPNKIPDIEENLKYGSDKVKVKYLRKLLDSEQPGASGFSREPTGLVHVFIDNSNAYIQGKKFVGKKEGLSENLICIDYGRLFKTVLDGRKYGDYPVIVGSRPPPDDSLWKDLEELGFKVKVFDRVRNKEKGVDIELAGFISDAIQDYKRPGILVLIAGDGDYGPTLRRALERGWIVEIWFWKEGFSHLLKWIDVDQPELVADIIYLDPYYLKFVYAFGFDYAKGKKFLEIDRADWNSSEVMKLYVNLGLFCWYHKNVNGSFYLYFNDIDQWKRAKRLVIERYPRVLEFKKDAYPN